jgi:hypothetical protein
MLNTIKIVVNRKAIAIYNIVISILFIKIGIYLILIKSNLRIFDLPLYPIIGILASVINLVLLLKWIGRFYNPTKN